MKKTIISLIFSFIFTIVALAAITFFTRLQTPEEKEKCRVLADSIALNSSGQGLSMPFVPKDGEEEIRFLTFCSLISDKEKECRMTVIIVLPESKQHATYSYPCKIQGNVIYSVGLEYVKYSTYCLQEYVLMATISFLLCFSIISAAKNK